MNDSARDTDTLLGSAYEKRQQQQEDEDEDEDEGDDDDEEEEQEDILLACSHNDRALDVLVKDLTGANFSSIQKFLNAGLSSEWARRLWREPNMIPNPNPFPAWLCCLLPCLMATPGMIAYNRMRAETACVKRDSNFFLIDSENLVVGDLVKLCEGEVVPADIRVLQVVGDTEAFIDISLLMKPTLRGSSVTQGPMSPTGRFNVVPAGSCVESRVNIVGIVIATGKHTFIGKRILSKQWR